MERNDCGLVCPKCSNPLILGKDECTCRTCKLTYAAVLGIPDLRESDPPYSTREEDISKARKLAAEFDQADFASLMRFGYGTMHPEIAADFLEQFVDMRVKRVGLNKQRWQRCKQLMETCKIDYSLSTAVDLGCGVGGLIPLLVKEMSHVVGIDISMEELILAKRFLTDQGIDSQVTLVCSEGETIPIRSTSVSLVNATSVIEHVRDAGAVLQAVFKSLTPGGIFLFDSPNRYDLVYPEPHVGVRFVGLWPRALQEPYVRLMSGKEYKEKRLLSLRELRSYLRRCVSSGNFVIFYWPRWQLGNPVKSMIGRFIIARWPSIMPRLNRIWAQFVGVHDVVLWKPKELNASPIHQIRPIPTPNE